MAGIDDSQERELDRLQRAIAEEEPRLAAAIAEYNAAIEIAYETLLERAAAYHRGREAFEHLHSEAGSAMMELAGEAGEDWQASEAGRAHLDWMNTWLEVASLPATFERPRRLTAPDPPLSAVIAGLPRGPRDLVDASTGPREGPEAGRSLDPEPPDPAEAGVEPDGGRYFEFVGGTSNKFWEVLQEGGGVTTRYGKIGTRGQSSTKTYDSPEKAAGETAKIVARKIKEGYVEKTAARAAARPPGGPRSMASDGWSGSVDPEPMLGTVLPSATDRERRLFAVACCRRVEDWLIGDHVMEFRDDHYRMAVETAERFADGQATPRELNEAFWAADDSAFCNDPVEDDVTARELRKANYGDDDGWVGRIRSIEAEDRAAVEAAADPRAWFEEEVEFINNNLDPYRDVAAEDAVHVGETIGRQVLLLVRKYGGRGREAVEKEAQAALIRDIFGDPYPPPAFDPAWRQPEVTALAASLYEGRAFERMPSLGDALEAVGCDDPILLDHCRGAGPHVRGCWALDRVLGKR